MIYINGIPVNAKSILSTKKIAFKMRMDGNVISITSTDDFSMELKNGQLILS